MTGLSTKARISLGQTGIVVSLLLLAAFLGLIPDRISAVREGRVALAEVLAAYGTLQANSGDIRRLESTMKLSVERNDDLLSVGLRDNGGRLVVSAGEHSGMWREMAGKYSDGNQIMVPILAQRSTWGHIELRFRPLTGAGRFAVLDKPLIKLAVFFIVLCFVVFYFYLGKMLKALDPSQAIPGRVRSALDTMAEGLLVLDTKAQIVLANQAFAAMVGSDPDELLGRPAAGFAWIGDDEDTDIGEDFPWLLALENNSVEKDFMLRLQLSESDQRTFMVNASPVLGPGGKAGGVLVSFDDITELEHKEIELRLSKDEAEAANRAKSDFLANMSHEIRTPMNSILGFTEVLKRGYGKNNADNQRYLNTIHTSGKHLLGLINDILDLSKVEAGRMEIEQQRFAPNLVIQETVRVLRVKAIEKGISLDFKVDGALPETILSDPSRLRQIVTNLLGNALKFTESGGVTVTVRLVDVEPRLLIEVTDTGIGMPPDRLDSVFEEFVQSHASITRRFGGTGLGLSIARRFARALGGDITVTSELGKGTTFSVMLTTGPLETIRLLQPEQLPSGDEQVSDVDIVQWNFPAARILVVDDGEENRDLTTLILEEVGLSVDQAENGKIAVDKAVAVPYDVILMDVQMPVMDGFTAVRTMREKGLEAPVIALTANAMKGFKEECLEAGYTGYMTKPIDIDGLIRKLAELLDVQRSDLQPGDGKRPGFIPEAAAAQSIDEPPIESTLGKGNPRFKKLVERFILRLSEQLAAMDTAWERRDYSTLAALGHWLKGSGGTVGFGVFNEPAHHLEQLAKTGSEEGIAETLQILHRLAARLAVADVQQVADKTPDEPKLNVPNPAQPRLMAVAAVAEALHETGTHARVPERIESRLANCVRLHPVIRRFVGNLPEQIDALATALSQGDHETLQQLAHKIKGTSGMVGFNELSAPAARLEAIARSRQLDDAEPFIDDIRRLADATVAPGNGILYKSNTVVTPKNSVSGTGL